MHEDYETAMARYRGRPFDDMSRDDLIAMLGVATFEVARLQRLLNGLAFTVQTPKSEPNLKGSYVFPGQDGRGEPKGE